MIKINSIKIKFFKGIEEMKYESILHPFMPHLFVAPNGFGKTSLATAFKSLNRDRIKLEEKNIHKNNNLFIPELEIIISNDLNKKELKATVNDNGISKVFEINVITNLIKPVANYRNIQGKHTTRPTNEIESIYLIEKIPDKFKITYNVSDFKKQINDKKNIWVDISELLKNDLFLIELEKLNVLEKFNLKTNQKIINDYINIVRKLNGSKAEIICKLNTQHLDILSNSFSNSIVQLLERFQDKSKAENILIAIQIIELYKINKNDFLKLFKYKNYCLNVKKILDIFNSFKTTWKDIKPKEINIYKKVKGKNKLVQKNFGIEFPEANDISNGERDVISFMGSLLKTQLNFSGKPTILIIDEVFDYLDDANLLAVQFYITKFIENFQNKNIEFFPIILTHLNPYYFKNYFFSKQKIHYLLSWKGQTDKFIENFVISRNNSNNQNYCDNISKFFLHYNPSQFDITNDAKNEFEFQKLIKFNDDLCKSEEFVKKVFKYFDFYISGKKNYDPISVCIASRILVEENIYKQLAEDLQFKFLQKRTTNEKLNFARHFSNINIPEIYYLLGTLYNELLHIRSNIDNSSPLYLKLNNLTIRSMINELNKHTPTTNLPNYS